MRFIDEITVTVKGGDGGKGLVGWHREKFVPRGGPDGGDGGNGGAVIFRTDPGLNTLIDFSFQPILAAEPGGQGDSNQKTGRNGEDLVCRIPVGTQVFFGETLVADLNVPGAVWVAARGGRGGKGNAFFKSATNQAPDYAQPGQPGEERQYRLVLKSVADVGLLGFPNVGKSTLIRAISSAQPKVADYPFTTLTPQLGAVLGSEGRRFVIADIPGVIRDAHIGRGLGIRFLKHVERTSLLVHLIDPSVQHEDLDASALDEFRSELPPTLKHEDPDLAELALRTFAQFRLIERELEAFSEELARKPRIVVFSKCDIEENQKALEITAPYFFERFQTAPLSISSVTRRGLHEFQELVFTRLAAEKIALIGQIPSVKMEE